MTTTLDNLNQPTLNQRSPGLTPEQIEQTYEQLGLNDPDVREFYESLEALNRQEEPQIWLRTSHHTSLPQ